MLLKDYDHHGRAWALDPRTGLLSPASGRCHGFVHAGEAGPAALYADPSDEAATLWLQIGRRRWDCDTVTVRQSTGSGTTRRFTVEEARGAALELLYPAPDSGPLDPTYDWMDAEADDFFLWAAGRLTDVDASARTTLLAHFRTGFTPT
ncbi:hypothetical protein ACWGII_01620 [Streptomyces sp. NPDC054855]